MSNKKKILIAVFSAIVLCAAVLGGVKLNASIQIKKYSTEIFPVKSNASELPKQEMTYCYLFDTSDEKKMVGYADYVFVATFDEVIGVTYEDVDVDDLGRVHGTPFTNYKISVLKNIKGELPTDRQIDFMKSGGPSIDGKYFCTVANDELPETGKEYLVVAYVDPSTDGLYTAGGLTCMPLGLSDKTAKASAKSNSLNDNAVTKLYLDAYKNQDTSVKPYSDRICKDSPNYKAGING